MELRLGRIDVAMADLSALQCSLPLQGELGVQAPVGFWDPLGLSADGDTEVFKRRREVELKCPGKPEMNFLKFQRLAEMPCVCACCYPA